MKSSIENAGFKKKLHFIMAITFAILYSLCCFAIAPLYASVVANVAYEDGALPTVLAYLDSLLTVVAIAVAYSVIILGKFSFGTDRFRGGSVIFVIATAAKYTANMLMSWISDRSIPLLWLWDAVDAVFYTALECIQLLVFVLIVNRLLSNHSERDAALKKANRVLGKASDEEKPYPFTKLYDKHNCLQRCAMIGAVVVLVSKLAGSLINDAWMIIIGGFPTEPVTVLLMVVNYLSSMIFGAVCYFVITFSLTSVVQKDKD